MIFLRVCNLGACAIPGDINVINSPGSNRSVCHCGTTMGLSKEFPSGFLWHEANQPERTWDTALLSLRGGNVNGCVAALAWVSDAGTCTRRY